MTLETKSTKKCPVLQDYAGQGVASTKLSPKLKAKCQPVPLRIITKKEFEVRITTNFCLCVRKYTNVYEKNVELK